MKPPKKPSIQRIVDDWVSKARLDIRSAETLLAHDPPLLYPSCFHSQQAAEKYLKALLASWSIEVPTTHELGRLLKIVEGRNADLAAMLIDVIVLNTYAVDIRRRFDRGIANFHQHYRAAVDTWQIFDASQWPPVLVDEGVNS